MLFLIFIILFVLKIFIVLFSCFETGLIKFGFLFWIRFACFQCYYVID